MIYVYSSILFGTTVQFMQAYCKKLYLRSLEARSLEKLLSYLLQLRRREKGSWDDARKRSELAMTTWARCRSVSQGFPVEWDELQLLNCIVTSNVGEQIAFALFMSLLKESYTFTRPWLPM